MYIIDTFTGDKAKEFALLPNPFGADFGKDIAQAVDRIEVHGTNCNDPGPDFCEYKAFADGILIAQRRIMGY